MTLYSTQFRINVMHAMASVITNNRDASAIKFNYIFQVLN